ncbi:MAG: uroporphyrinogen-III synthase, partial [Acidobacteriota bacterium]
LARAAGEARWLCVTSPRGVEALARRWDRPPAHLRVAAVGPATAASVRRRWGRVDLEAGLAGSPATARGLADALLRLGPPTELGAVVVVTADRGRRELESTLSDRGVPVTRFELYRTVPTPPRGRRDDLRRVLARRREPAADAVTVASPSAFEGLCNQVELPAEMPLITLGPTTSAAVRRAGSRVTAEARRPTLDALLDAADGVAAGR